MQNTKQKVLGIEIDGVVRDFLTQFDRIYRKTFIHNESLVKADIPSHAEARVHGIKDTEFVAKETTEEERRTEMLMAEKKEKQLIFLPVNSEDLLNHYHFEEKVLNFIDSDGKKTEDEIITPQQSLEKFIYEDYPFQIFGRAEEIEKANEWANKIQNFGKMKGYYKTVFFSKVSGMAIPATYSFLGTNHSRIRNLIIVENDIEKWDYCDVLIDCNPRAIQSVPKDKEIIRILREWNKYDNIDYSYSSLKEVYNSGILDKLFK